MAANLYGAGQPVQGRLGTGLETDDEVVDAEPFVLVDRAGQLVDEAGERSAASLAGISQLPVHAYGAAQGGRVAAFGLQRCPYVGQPLAQPLVGQPEPGGVPGIGVACGQPQHPRAVAGYQDWDRPVRRREQYRVADLVVAAGKGQPLAAQERSDNLQRLFEPGGSVVG